LHLLVFGLGYVGHALVRRMGAQGWNAAATVRGPAGLRAAQALGADPVDPADAGALAAAASLAHGILVTAPPSASGCPGLAALAPAIAASQARPAWIGYLSSTGVYGDRAGGWVFETSGLNAQSAEGARRVAAEHDWLAFGAAAALTVTIFRLPGIYGAGRSPFERLREGTARRLVKPGHVFSRIHVDDLCAGLQASIARPRAGGIYNLCDDEPAPADVVTAYAARLLGIAPPAAEPFDPATLSSVARRFYEECKRVANARAKAELGWRPAYPTYREGLAAILDQMRLDPLSSD
jgi:nucleoside-diphosphate-sugar epimerase